jgi:ElaB/YqjD/DUF883 family membrane-anchored ribosome-binding protein
MITNKPFDPSNGLADQASATATADNAIRSTQRVANEALDSLAGGAQTLRNEVSPMINRAGEQASAFAQRGVNAVRDSTQQLRDRALRVSDSTVMYIKDEPLKSMLIAAATGAALMALVGMLSRSHGRH